MAKGPRRVTPTDGMAIREDTSLAPGVYHLPRGIRIEADGVTLDGSGALLIGSEREGRGVSLEGRSGVTIRHLRRPGGLRYGHMGADAAGFLVVRASCRNTFRCNTARLGGDGFFLAGLSPDGEKLGCDDNLFEENDGSLSPNIAFEATFCRGNVFRDDYADRCNYGFWLGFSWDAVVESNGIVGDRQAGVRGEDGHGIEVGGKTVYGRG